MGMTNRNSTDSRGRLRKGTSNRNCINIGDEPRKGMSNRNSTHSRDRLRKGTSSRNCINSGVNSGRELTTGIELIAGELQ
jgi:hypothetical protein